MKVLFVCTANQCRSAVAAEMFRKLLKREGMDNCEVCSAGILAVEGYPASEMAIISALKMGIDLSKHISQPLTGELIQESDLVLVMEKMHRTAVVKMCPDSSDKVKLLRSYAYEGADEEEIFDPTGSFDPLTYRTCFSLILESLEGLIKYLKTNN